MDRFCRETDKANPKRQSANLQDGDEIIQEHRVLGVRMEVIKDEAPTQRISGRRFSYMPVKMCPTLLVLLVHQAYVREAPG